METISITELENMVCGGNEWFSALSQFYTLWRDFLIFSDYCKPAIRLSALMGLRVIYVFSHLYWFR